MNPQAFVQNFMKNSRNMNNPTIKNAIDMANKGDVQGLQKLAENVSKEKNVNLNDYTQKVVTEFHIPY